MARFDRKVERNKSGYQFTTKEIEKDTFVTKCKANFGISWLPKKWSTLGIILADFIFSTFIFIPLLMKYFDRNTSLILGHSIVTSLLIILIFYIVIDEKPKLIEMFIRYCFLAILLGAFAVFATMVV